MSESTELLGKVQTQGTFSSDLLQLVSFNLGDEEFGIDILRVQEIIRMVDITRVPNAPSFVIGVINLRGKVIPVIDLNLRMALNTSELSNNSRIIVIEFEGKVVGFLVDKVNEVLRIDKSITEPPPQMVGSVNSDFITGIGKLENRLLILLDLEKLLNKVTDPEITGSVE
ncbi:MAG: chemotaxis protein CheW [Candidatus Kapabacteria bacterium]|nr:chemotaxis protein CheW [Candidatus Kapabacteria bacterium]